VRGLLLTALKPTSRRLVAAPTSASFCLSSHSETCRVLAFFAASDRVSPRGDGPSQSIERGAAAASSRDRRVNLLAAISVAIPPLPSSSAMRPGPHSHSASFPRPPCRFRAPAAREAFPDGSIPVRDRIQTFTESVSNKDGLAALSRTTTRACRTSAFPALRSRNVHVTRTCLSASPANALRASGASRRIGPLPLRAGRHPRSASLGKRLPWGPRSLPPRDRGRGLPFFQPPSRPTMSSPHGTRPPFDGRSA